MAGLSQWASQLQLRRRQIPLWLLLLLLPLLLLLILSLKDCSSPEFFGSSITTNSFIIIMDNSTSMEPHFPRVQQEARKTLENLTSSFFSTHYANIIAYHSSATTALGSIKEVNDETGSQLIQFLDNLKAGGGTNLRSGIELAAKEVAAHQKPTTLIILTDGQDSSIDQMLQDRDTILNQFQHVEIIGNTLTPRIFDVKNPKPINEVETKLNELAKTFNGQFGEVK
jgi:Mg-chelatase subunit ChlD